MKFYFSLQKWLGLCVYFKQTLSSDEQKADTASETYVQHAENVVFLYLRASLYLEKYIKSWQSENPLKLHCQEMHFVLFIHLFYVPYFNLVA